MNTSPMVYLIIKLIETQDVRKWEDRALVEWAFSVAQIIMDRAEKNE